MTCLLRYGRERITAVSPAGSELVIGDVVTTGAEEIRLITCDSGEREEGACIECARTRCRPFCVARAQRTDAISVKFISAGACEATRLFEVHTCMFHAPCRIPEHADGLRNATHSLCVCVNVFACACVLVRRACACPCVCVSERADCQLMPGLGALFGSLALKLRHRVLIILVRRGCEVPTCARP